MDSIYSETFGETLKFFRKQQAMTQKQLAAQVGVHVNTIWAWERGDYLPDTKGIVLELANQLRLNDFQSRRLLEASLTHSTLLPYWYVPYQRNPFFVGREAILNRLHQLFRLEPIEDRTAALGLTGMGGIGKTQTALEYAYHSLQDYTAIFWLNAQTNASLIDSFKSIAKVLKASPNVLSNHNTAIAAVLDWLNSHNDWLLIVDHIDNPEMIKPFLPAARHGTLLYTTQLPSLGNLASVITLEPLSLEESTHLLRQCNTHQLVKCQAQKSPSVEEENAALALAMVLGGLPLALDQARTYIEQTRCSLAEFLQVFEEHPLQLLNERDTFSDHPHSVVSTFTTAFEKLHQEQPAAATLLTWCCFLAPDTIPEALFTEYIAYQDPMLQGMKREALEFHAILKALLKHSLITRHPQQKTISVHRLVQVVLKGRFSEAQQKIWNERCIDLLNRIFQIDPDQIQVEHWSRYEQLLPHALQCVRQAVSWNKASVELGSLLAKMAAYCFQRERFQEAEPLYKQALSTLQQCLEPTSLDLAFVFIGLGSTQYRLHQFQAAESSYRNALSVMKIDETTDPSRLPLLYQRRALLLHGMANNMEEENLHHDILQFHKQLMELDHFHWTEFPNSAPHHVKGTGS
ncbi:tetratricopeptide repeat protein [Ktedonospora formicarum]|nr:tetratricopeptide repeat protein [Ktedonospora formicarum]